jgi:thioredoxin-related protein
MKKIAIIVLVMLSFALNSTVYANDGWLTDLAQAKVEAKKSNKLILAVLSGSDWCHWCKKMDKEVFTTAEFKTFAKKHFVLLFIDFPRKKKISPALRKQNRGILKTYKVKYGWVPTTLLLDANGKLLGKRTGYGKKGVKFYIKHLKKMMK